MLPSGALLATHDEFGPGSSECTQGRTFVYRSDDGGKTWARIGEAHAFWSTLFLHQERVYLLGTTHMEGASSVVYSKNGGETWSEPSVLRDQGRWHGSTTPVVRHEGRIWRGWETCSGNDFAMKFAATVLSCSEDADLTDPNAWIECPAVRGDPAWLRGSFNGWLEGNVVIDRNASLNLLLRVDLHPRGVVRQTEFAARFQVEPMSGELRKMGFVKLPGGAKKFTIRWDEASQRYWSLTNPSGVLPEGRAPAQMRNRLALVSSPDLHTWRVERTIVRHRDFLVHGYQYADWIFAGHDILAVVRTSHDDAAGGANTFHDSNYITFHRVERFREFARGNA
jgi:hypothetical protein